MTTAGEAATRWLEQLAAHQVMLEGHLYVFREIMGGDDIAQRMIAKVKAESEAHFAAAREQCINEFAHVLGLTEEQREALRRTYCPSPQRPGPRPVVVDLAAARQRITNRRVDTSKDT